MVWKFMLSMEVLSVLIALASLLVYTKDLPK